MSDFLGMSDEDFAKQSVPGQEAPSQEGAAPVVDPSNPSADGSQADVVSDPPASPEVVPPAQDPKVEEPVKQPEEAPKVDPANPATKPATQDNPAAASDPNASKPNTQQENVKTNPNPAENSSPNYEEFYGKVMKPFKANGREISVKSPEEAVQLMQMGANYTRKMMEIAPHRKTLMMLQNNGLMDEGELSFLIDIKNKNPEAIKKLIKDSGIDPLEIDTTVEPAYRPGNHRVGDDELRFHTVLDTVKSSEGGEDTVKAINNDWDQASKEVLWKSPEIMQVIHEQRGNGIYGRIADEVNRRRTLGQISAETPFLTAYRAVGDDLASKNAFDDLQPKSPQVSGGNSNPNPTPATNPVTPVVSPAPVASRVAAPKPQVNNSDRAAAAGTPRSSPATAKVLVNPLAMSDEDFLKQMQGRV